MLLVGQSASAQLKFFALQKDSIPLFRGFAVSFDLVGAAMMQLSDYGQYEGALRINLHDEWFPIVEVGYGKANHEDDPVTGLRYKTAALRVFVMPIPVIKWTWRVTTSQTLCGSGIRVSA